MGEQGAQVKRNQQLGCRRIRLPANSASGSWRGWLHNPLFFSAVLPLRILPPLFNRYTGGGEYGLHVDGSVMSQAGTAQRLRSDVSSTLFLCEPDEYDGGELVVQRHLRRARGEAAGRRPDRLFRQAACTK